jgi:hypothetical protein
VESSTVAAATGSGGLYVKENDVRTTVDAGDRNGNGGNSPSQEDDESSGLVTASAAGWHPHCVRTYREKRW